jgi:endonuclease/exonuclease/phosphatase (EEP) superfamily protein YafD
LAAVAGAWLLLQWSDLWWPATILMFAPRWLLALPLAVLAPAALLLRKRTALLLLAAALLVCGPVTGFNVPWKRLADRPPAGKPFRVMTLNMHYRSADPKALEDLIAAIEPDAVVVQEWPASGRSALNSAPGWHTHATPRLFLASRHPLRTAVDLGDDSMGEHASAARYELDTPLGVLNVISLHTATDREGITDTIHENRKGPAEVRANSARRREQCEYLAREASQCRGPVLVMGDFNTPPESAIFPEVWSVYVDAFQSAGWGWGYTFIGARTAVRIDHVLTGRGWSCSACRVGPYVGSPHRPVIAELVWDGGP